ncbi:MAG: hypothetical protein EOP84_22370, partial [Verrucomicrobiaceae bacterium]
MKQFGYSGGCCLFILAAMARISTCRAEDWPQWRGHDRNSVWHEGGLIHKFPQEGLRLCWQVPVGHGFSSPCVAGGRVFITDSVVTPGMCRERVHCFSALTGQEFWSFGYSVPYPEYGADPQHPFGPVATPAYSGGKIYILGRMSDLICLDALTGKVEWRFEAMVRYQTTNDLRGFNSSPVVEGGLVIICVAKSLGVSV